MAWAPRRRDHTHIPWDMSVNRWALLRSLFAEVSPSEGGGDGGCGGSESADEGGDPCWCLNGGDDGGGHDGDDAGQECRQVNDAPLVGGELSCGFLDWLGDVL